MESNSAIRTYWVLSAWGGFILFCTLGCPGGGLEFGPYSVHTSTDGSYAADASAGETDVQTNAQSDASVQSNANVSTSDNGSCVQQPDADTLALYTFDDDGDNNITDSTGEHPGRIFGADITKQQGQDRCGQAISFGGVEDNYILVENTDVFSSLKVGSVDFWFRLLAPEEGREMGLLSRDAMGQNKSGHLSISIKEQDNVNKVRVRLQELAGDGKTSFEVYTPQINDAKWHHLGVNFGPPAMEVFLDHNKAGSADISVGIDGNENPWVLGGGIWQSAEGKADVVLSPFHGMLDSVRISRVRREFSN